MYADLLTRALGKGEEGHRSNDLLMADLVHSRARLQATDGGTTVAEALVRELSYDGALDQALQGPRGSRRGGPLRQPHARAGPARK